MTCSTEDYPDSSEHSYRYPSRNGGFVECHLLKIDVQSSLFWAPNILLQSLSCSMINLMPSHPSHGWFFRHQWTTFGVCAQEHVLIACIDRGVVSEPVNVLECKYIPRRIRRKRWGLKQKLELVSGGTNFQWVMVQFLRAGWWYFYKKDGQIL